jgi:transcriptional regulator with XRE-family HTH domain
MLGERIRKLRRERDWTQKDLAERVGVDYKNISNYEVGRLVPSRKTLAKFATVFGIDPSELQSDRPQEPTLAIGDPELLNLFHELSAFPDSERGHVKWMLSAIVKQQKMKEMMAS